MIDKHGSEWLLGRFGEFRISRWFRDHGVYTIATADIETHGGAPLIVGKVQSLPVMDLQVVGNGRIAWCECKYKEHPAHLNIAHSWRHGIDLVKWASYREIERVTGLCSYLAFYQNCPEEGAPPAPVILLADFQTLREHVILEKGGRGGNVQMAYWDIDKTPFLIFPDDGSGHPKIKTIHAPTHPWSRPARDGSLSRERELKKREEKRKQGNLFGAI
jgi:hypothetical protein